MVTFTAKIEGKDELITGNSLVFENSTRKYVIHKSGLGWIDGYEWSSIEDWEFIDIETLIIK